MARLLLISHRAPDQPGGPSARWRSLQRHLPPLGWEVDVVSARSHATSSEFPVTERGRRLVALRSWLMSRLRRVAGPTFRFLGTEPPPLSILWLVPGYLEARRRLRLGDYDAVAATAPPVVALVVARLAMRHSGLPLIIDFRDLWAGNPAYDPGGRLLPAVERWITARADAIIACTPEAAADIRARHTSVAERVHVIANGFEPELLARRHAPRRPDAEGVLEILHSGTLTLHRPLTPLLQVLRRRQYRSRTRLVLHGYLVPELARQARAAAEYTDIVVLPPSSWTGAIDRIAGCDVTLVTQAESAGDTTAVASKVYEYLALGKPVLCLTDGGATENLLRRLGADHWCARLDDLCAIAAALDDLLVRSNFPAVAPEVLEPYTRLRIAEAMSEVLNSLVASPSQLAMGTRPAIQ
jgi:glycosyltransferase involved in cell wall biosynthesis